MNIIITGASSGIGYATALALAKKGDHKILAIARSNVKLEQLQNQVKDLDSNVTFGFVSFDLASEDYWELEQKVNQFFDFKNEELIDIVINNAGYLVNIPLLDAAYDDWEKSMKINAFSILKLSQLLFPYFSKTKLTHIVNIGSMGGVQGAQKFPGLGVYSASKAAVNSITESMATEWKQYNIHINAINPGAVKTEMLAKAFPDFNAPITAAEFGVFLADFALNNGPLMNGKLLEVSLQS